MIRQWGREPAGGGGGGGGGGGRGGQTAPHRSARRHADGGERGTAASADASGAPALPAPCCLCPYTPRNCLAVRATTGTVSYLSQLAAIAGTKVANESWGSDPWRSTWIDVRSWRAMPVREKYLNVAQRGAGTLRRDPRRLASISLHPSNHPAPPRAHSLSVPSGRGGARSRRSRLRFPFLFLNARAVVTCAASERTHPRLRRHRRTLSGQPALCCSQPTPSFLPCPLQASLAHSSSPPSPHLPPHPLAMAFVPTLGTALSARPAAPAAACRSAFAGAAVARAAAPRRAAMTMSSIQDAIEAEVAKAKAASEQYGKTSKEAAAAWYVRGGDGCGSQRGQDFVLLATGGGRGVEALHLVRAGCDLWGTHWSAEVLFGGGAQRVGRECSCGMTVGGRVERWRSCRFLSTAMAAPCPSRCSLAGAYLPSPPPFDARCYYLLCRH